MFFRLVVFFVCISIKSIGQVTDIPEPKPTVAEFKNQSLSTLQTVVELSNFDFTSFTKMLLVIDNELIDTIDLHSFNTDIISTEKTKSWVCDSLLKKPLSCYKIFAHSKKFLKGNFSEIEDCKISIENKKIKATKTHANTGNETIVYFDFDNDGNLLTKQIFNLRKDKKIPVRIQTNVYTYENGILKQKTDSIFDNFYYESSPIPTLIIESIYTSLTLSKIITKRLQKNGIFKIEEEREYTYDDENKITSIITKINGTPNYSSFVKYIKESIEIATYFHEYKSHEYKYQFIQ